MTQELLSVIRDFVGRSVAPVLIEPGEEPVPLTEGSFSIEPAGTRILIQAWNESKTLTRRVTAVTRAGHGRLELAAERFGKTAAPLIIVDEARPGRETTGRKAARAVLREQFRRWLARQFPGWRIGDVTVEMDLEHTLSPVYPRALARRGGSGWAAMASPPGPAAADGLLTAALIWLDYLRHREHRTSIEGLALFVPAGEDRTTCLRLRWLDPHATRVAVFTYDEQGWEEQIDPAQHGNLDTRVDPPGALPDPPRDPTLPEAILERQVRRNLATIDAHLCPAPVYGQVPALAGVERGIMDLLAIDRGGRLAVIELKVTPEPRLPIQALDYWMRVRWHQRAGDFERMGYFAGKAISADPPRLLLVAPALEFHPTTETILRYFASAIPVERVGLAVEWRREPRVLFRRRGAMPPH